MPAGQTDPTLAKFSIAHDLADVLPLTKQAEQLNPALTMMASPWTAPAWMKDSGQLNGGWLKAENYGAYANYFVKYLQAYQATRAFRSTTSPRRTSRPAAPATRR